MELGCTQNPALRNNTATRVRSTSKAVAAALLYTRRPTEAVADTMAQGGMAKSLSDAKHCL